MNTTPARTRRPTFPMWAVWAAVAVHGGLWLGLQADRGEHLGAGHPQQRPAPTSNPALHARLTTQAPATHAAAMTSNATQPNATTEQTPTQPPTQASADTTPDTLPEHIAPTDATSPTVHQASNEPGPDTYLSRDAVDQGPQPVSLIQIPYPEGVQPVVASNGPSGQVHTGRLTLYIDENGAVRRVQVNSTELPEPFQEAARNAFLQARFVPGQRQGQAVKVRIDIEVSFDDRDTSPRPSPQLAA